MTIYRRRSVRLACCLLWALVPLLVDRVNAGEVYADPPVLNWPRDAI